MSTACSTDSNTPIITDIGYYQKTPSTSNVSTELPNKERFNPITTTPNLHHGTEHWFRYGIPKDLTDQRSTWYLQIAFPNIDAADVYVQYDNSITTAGRIGDDVPHREWPIDTRLPTVPLTTGDQTATAVIFNFKATGQAAVLPVKLIDQANYVKQEQNDYLWYGLFFGALLGLILYNLLLYLNTKIISYLAYVLYLTAFTLLQASITGLGQQYLWPTLTNFTTYFALCLISLTNSLMAVFVTIFLELKQRQPKSHFLLRAIALVSLIFPFGLLILNYIHIQNAQYIFSLASMLIISAIAIIEWRRGSRPAVYLLTSYSILFAGIIMSILYFAGLMKANFLTVHLMEIAIIFEALILALGMSDRINELRNNAQYLEQRSRSDQEIFTRRLVSAHESEKQHFGAILHDDVGHRILNLQYEITKFAQNENTLSPASQETLSSFTQSTQDILQELRDLARTSHPHLLREIGLKHALESLMEKAFVSQNISYACNIRVHTSSEFLQQQLYRIVQELVSNTIKHANASEVLLNITQMGESIQLTYKDDGIGISSAAVEGSDSFGIVSIRERCKLISGDLLFEFDQPQGMSCSIKNIDVHEKQHDGFTG